MALATTKKMTNNNLRTNVDTISSQKYMGYSVKALGRLSQMKWSQLVEHLFGVAFQCAFPHQTSINLLIH